MLVCVCTSLSLKVSASSQFSQLQTNDNYFAACYDNGVLHVSEDLSTNSCIITFNSLTLYVLVHMHKGYSD
jgi:hypothetical protein